MGGYAVYKGMTRGESLQYLADKCTRLAVKCRKNRQGDLAAFWAHAGQGFQKSLEQLTLEECAAELPEV